MNTVFDKTSIPFKGVDLSVYAHVLKNSQSIILVHGIGVSNRYMLPLARELSETNTVYIIDLPGFGKSPRPTGSYDLTMLAESIDTLITHEKLKKPILAGNSFGCQVILALLKKHPHIASKAILIGPTVNLHERNYPVQIIRWLQNIKHEPIKKWLPVLAKDIMDCGIIHAFRTLRIAIQDKPEDNMKIVKIPILLVRGELDRIVPRNWLNLLCSMNDHCLNMEISNAGHALNFNSPQHLAFVIRKFINTSFV